jgi:hypothetical protein
MHKSIRFFLIKNSGFNVYSRSAYQTGTAAFDSSGFIAD